MIIIVEGIDRVGKTTLCEKLNKELKIPIYKHKNNQFDYNLMDNKNETDKMLQLIDLYEILGGNIIFDRFHWSDYVYGALERNYDAIESSKNIEKIEEKLLKNNAIIVYIRPTNIEESSRQHGKNLDKYNKLMELCYYMCKLRKVKVISCDYNSIDKIVEDIKNGRI